MSAKSIALFARHQDQGTTRPPPPADDPASEFAAQARRYHLKASRYLAKALEYEAMAELLATKDRHQ